MRKALQISDQNQGLAVGQRFIRRDPEFSIEDIPILIVLDPCLAPSVFNSGLKIGVRHYLNP